MSKENCNWVVIASSSTEELSHLMKCKTCGYESWFIWAENPGVGGQPKVCFKK